MSLAAITSIISYGAVKLYPLQKIRGELYLEGAPSKVSIQREADSGILHIEGKDMTALAYGAGFAQAQNRLW